MYSELKNLLIAKKSNLFWHFVKQNSWYDAELAAILWMSADTCRYWDAIWNEQKIEFKKWRSIWLDLIRYSEILLKISPESSEDTITIFFIPDTSREKIVQIIWVKTEKIIQKLKLDLNISKSLIEMQQRMPRSLNAQASLTVKDVRDFADFII